MLPIAIGAFVLALILTAGSRTVPGQKLLGKITRPGRQLVQFTQVKVPTSRGSRIKIQEEPGTLANEAARRLGREVPLETFTLATIMASEAGGVKGITLSQLALAKIGIAHAALTAAKKEGKTLFGLVAPDGYYGSQLGHSRYASTRQPPSAADIELAEAVRGGKVGNPAPRATQWDSPQAQDKLAASGAPGYVDKEGRPITALVVAARRRAAGQEAVLIPGVDESYLRLWRPVA